MQTQAAVLLFILFALILFSTYIAIRRHWGSPLLVAPLGIIASIVVVTLSALARSSSLSQAIFSGLLVGGMFSIGVVAMAYYFSVNEQRRQQAPDGEKTDAPLP
ncbi:MAG: hypothetical protein ABI835_16230 [Chloroflexota bacterium]